MDEGQEERRRRAFAPCLEAWADDVVAGLDAQEDLEWSLLHALRRSPTLREETAVRRADALRAAALGLGADGCAVAAGVSERMLRNWQAQDPEFAAAMAAAVGLAARDQERARAAAAPAGPGSAALRVVLKAVREGAVQSAAAMRGGWSEQSFLRLRRKSPEVAALLAAARRARAKKTDRRGKPRFERRYRLVRIEEGDMAAAAPTPDAGDVSGEAPRDVSAGMPGGVSREVSGMVPDEVSVDSAG
ncbi:hypothetical protein [Streptomyces sp. NPDC059063]|uniref:hypothetical protein n=1 Tax=unclassified Streptomyces TaxID=2593676 RepID=UPI0036A887F8